MRNFTKWLGTVLGVLLVGGIFVLPRIEQAYAPDAANIQDVGDAVWYAVVTLTTVGYGDFYPVSVPGQIVGVIFVLSSLGVLGVLIGKVADLFATYREHRRLGHHGLDASGHLVIFGWNDSTARIVEQLQGLGKAIVVVTHDRQAVDTIHERFPEVVFPLYSEFDDPKWLDRVNLRQAHRALLNIDSDTDTLIHLLNLRKHFPDVEFVVAVHNEELKATFRNAGVAKVVSSDTNAAHVIASVIFEPDVARFAQELIATTHNGDEFDLQQYTVEPESRIAGMTYGDLFRSLHDARRVLPIGLSKGGEDASPLLKLPDDEVTVEAGDTLILIARGRDIGPLQRNWGLTRPGGSSAAP
ncbi:MAG: TrkA family potassium uptake protein [Salinibacter sp.]